MSSLSPIGFTTSITVGNATDNNTGASAKINGSGTLITFGDENISGTISAQNYDTNLTVTTITNKETGEKYTFTPNADGKGIGYTVKDPKTNKSTSIFLNETSTVDIGGALFTFNMDKSGVVQSMAAKFNDNYGAVFGGIASRVVDPNAEMTLNVANRLGGGNEVANSYADGVRYTEREKDKNGVERHGLAVINPETGGWRYASQANVKSAQDATSTVPLSPQAASKPAGSASNNNNSGSVTGKPVQKNDSPFDAMNLFGTFSNVDVSKMSWKALVAFVFANGLDKKSEKIKALAEKLSAAEDADKPSLQIELQQEVQKMQTMQATYSQINTAAAEVNKNLGGGR